MFADREAGKFGPINLGRATWYGHAHKIIEGVGGSVGRNRQRPTGREAEGYVDVHPAALVSL
jgi:hypothetical protein